MPNETNDPPDNLGELASTATSDSTPAKSLAKPKEFETPKKRIQELNRAEARVKKAKKTNRV
jgi:hypothetical protein